VTKKKPSVVVQAPQPPSGPAGGACGSETVGPGIDLGERAPSSCRELTAWLDDGTKLAEALALAQANMFTETS